MKRFGASLMLTALVLLAAFSAAFGAGPEDAFYKFVKSVQPVAAKIASRQKPVLEEASPTDRELQEEFGYPPVSYGRLWQDKKNCVAYAYVSAWRGATLGYFETTDASFRFAGNIHVGSSYQQVLKFFGERGNGNNRPFIFMLDGMAVTFRFNNGKVSKICFAMFEDSGLGGTDKIWSIIKNRNDAAQR